MGLRETIQRAAETAFVAIGNIAVSGNYLAHSSTTYNASTGTPTATISTVAGVTFVFQDFSIREIDGEKVRPEDKRALIPSRAIASVVPQPDDQIVASGVAWQVIGASTDPADAVWTLQVRRP